MRGAFCSCCGPAMHAYSYEYMRPALERFAHVLGARGGERCGPSSGFVSSTCNQPVMTKSPSYYLPAPALCCSDSVFYAQSPSCSPCLPPAALQRRAPPAAAPLTPAAAAAFDTCSARPFARACRLDDTMAAAYIAAYTCPCSLSPFCVPPLLPLVPLFLSL